MKTLEVLFCRMDPKTNLALLTPVRFQRLQRVLSQETLPWYKRLFPFLGPAFIAAVAYIDPGNFATNIQGGAQLGYTLLWVIIVSNLMAMLVQILSAKLGIATGLNLAELCRDHFPRPLVWVMWVILEIVAIATDLAEFVGTAVGLFLLFGIPLVYAGLLTAVATFLVIGLQRYGFRAIEAVISVMIGIVAAGYLVEIFLVKPDPAQIVSSLFSRASGTVTEFCLPPAFWGQRSCPMSSSFIPP